ncbi:MAG: hypothetical protein EBQ59_03400 [Verrucomicrobia bacterium]|nr:hypothetical protein [Verrucomicrobiota bacterium]
MKTRPGWALLFVLTLLSGLFLTVLALSAWLVVSSREAAIGRHLRLLRMGAEAAARRGVGELQERAGQDDSQTFDDPAAGLCFKRREDRNKLSGEFTAEDTRLSWRIEDLSLKYDVSAGLVAPFQSSSWAKTSAGRQKLWESAPDAKLNSWARQALILGDHDLFYHHAGWTEKPGVSWGVRGLLTDPVAGGFKYNLSSPSVLKSVLGQRLAEAILAPPALRPPSLGWALQYEKEGARLHTNAPILTDFRMSLGLFNSRSDGRHRLRFHGTMVWWNPSASPVLANSTHRLFLVEIQGAPEVTIKNINSTATFTTALDDCPQFDLGVIEQRLREQGLWFWADIGDPSLYGMERRGLLPGEVFALITPSPTSQPQGLARILTRTTWKMDTAVHGPTWRRPSVTVFQPTDKIEITVRFPEKLSLRFRPATVEADRDTLISEYPSSPMITIENITMPDFRILTTGADYSREDSSSYVIGERRACLRLHLRHEEPAELLSRAHSHDLLKTYWNLDDPLDAADWVIDNPLLSILDEHDFPQNPAEGTFWDTDANLHDAESAGAFAVSRLREFILPPLVSTAALRHLEAPTGKEWFGCMDKGFCAAPLSAPEVGVFSHNPRLVPWISGSTFDEASAAEKLALRGAFNINSREVAAWVALLTSASFVWQAEAGGPQPVGQLAGNSFFNHPSGAQLAKWAAVNPIDLSREKLGSLRFEDLTNVSMQQSARCLTAAEIKMLATKIVELQTSCGWPFSSLKAWAESGLLEQAIKQADINSFLGSDLLQSPLSLRADAMMEALAPMISVRGDTFRVIGRAEMIGVGQGGACEIEWIVQRMPEPHSQAMLGRQFRIISTRIRNL